MSYLEELLPEFRKGAKIRFNSWGKGQYICIKDGQVIDEQGRKVFNIGTELTLLNQWELYQEPIDWNYIIKNKCLCWFYDDEKKYKTKGIMVEYRQEKKQPFVCDYRTPWENCRPVRRDEVTFYEDRKDE